VFTDLENIALVKMVLRYLVYKVGENCFDHVVVSKTKKQFKDFASETKTQLPSLLFVDHAQDLDDSGTTYVQVPPFEGTDLVFNRLLPQIALFLQHPEPQQKKKGKKDGSDHHGDLLADRFNLADPGNGVFRSKNGEKNGR
jgi:hypothetical protein